MSSIGHMFKLLFYDMGPLGSVLLVLLALASMWLGYRFSRPSNNQLSIRRPKTPMAVVPRHASEAVPEVNRGGELPGNDRGPIKIDEAP